MNSTLSTIKTAKELGRKGYCKYIYSACIDCGELRWVHLIRGKPEYDRCYQCGKRRKDEGGENSPHWKGGRIKTPDGYIKVRIYPDDFFYSMRCDKAGYVLEHRLVVAKALGRCLHSWEVVHHKKGFARDENRYPETLQLMSDLGHKQLTLLEKRIERLEIENLALSQRILILEAERVLQNA